MTWATRPGQVRATLARHASPTGTRLVPGAPFSQTCSATSFALSAKPEWSLISKPT